MILLSKYLMLQNTKHQQGKIGKGRLNIGLALFTLKTMILKDVR